MMPWLWRWSCTLHSKLLGWPLAVPSIHVGTHIYRHIASHQFHRLESIWRQSFGQADDPAVMSPLDGLRKLSEQFGVAPTRSS